MEQLGFISTQVSSGWDNALKDKFTITLCSVHGGN
jgi:hypothetical protein